MVRWVWIDRQIEGEDVKELERESPRPIRELRVCARICALVL